MNLKGDIAARLDRTLSIRQKNGYAVRGLAKRIGRAGNQVWSEYSWCRRILRHEVNCCWARTSEVWR